MQSLLPGFEDYTGSVLDDPKQATEAAAGAIDAGRHALGRKQAADMEAFFAPYVLGDERLLMDLCRDYEPYTVETLLYVPLDLGSYFKLEVEEDGYLSGLRGFNAWDVINKARRNLTRDKNAKQVFHRRSWPTDVTQYLEAVVPAERLAEVATLVEPFFSVADLFSMAEEHYPQILIMLEKQLTCDARFLYRYLQAARRIHDISVHYTSEERNLVSVLHSTRRTRETFTFTLAGKFTGQKLLLSEGMGQTWISDFHGL